MHISYLSIIIFVILYLSCLWWYKNIQPLPTKKTPNNRFTFVARCGTLIVTLINIHNAVFYEHAQMLQVSRIRGHVCRKRQV